MSTFYLFTLITLSHTKRVKAIDNQQIKLNHIVRSRSGEKEEPKAQANKSGNKMATKMTLEHKIKFYVWAKSKPNTVF